MFFLIHLKSMIPFFSLCMIHFLPIFAPDKTVKSPRSKKRIHRVLNIDTIIDIMIEKQKRHCTSVVLCLNLFFRITCYIFVYQEYALISFSTFEGARSATIEATSSSFPIALKPAHA